MKWFSVKIEDRYHKPDEGYRIFSLYDILTGDIFFKLEVDFNNKTMPYYYQALEDYESIGEELKELVLTMKEDEPYFYDRYIKPLFRESKINKILI